MNGADTIPINRMAHPAILPSNGNGHRSATDKQRAFIQGLVAKIKGFGHAKLIQLSNRMYGKGTDSLTSFEASGLIDTLKAIRDGKLDATAIMEGSEDG